jgi:hypothetical protein
MPQDQNAGRGHNKKIDNICFETMEQFRYVGTTYGIKIQFRKKLRAV